MVGSIAQITSFGRPDVVEYGGSLESVGLSKQMPDLDAGRALENSLKTVDLI
jgi:hypothetical protein